MPSLRAHDAPAAVTARRVMALVARYLVGALVVALCSFIVDALGTAAPLVSVTAIVWSLCVVGLLVRGSMRQLRAAYLLTIAAVLTLAWVIYDGMGYFGRVG